VFAFRYSFRFLTKRVYCPRVPCANAVHVLYAEYAARVLFNIALWLRMNCERHNVFTFTLTHERGEFWVE